MPSDFAPVCSISPDDTASWAGERLPRIALGRLGFAGRNVREVPETTPIQAVTARLGSPRRESREGEPPVLFSSSRGHASPSPARTLPLKRRAGQSLLLCRRQVRGLQGLVTYAVVMPFRRAGQLRAGSARFADLDHDRLLMRADRLPAMRAFRRGCPGHSASIPHEVDAQ